MGLLRAVELALILAAGGTALEGSVEALRNELFADARRSVG